MQFFKHDVDSIETFISYHCKNSIWNDTQLNRIIEFLDSFTTLLIEISPNFSVAIEIINKLSQINNSADQPILPDLPAILKETLLPDLDKLIEDNGINYKKGYSQFAERLSEMKELCIKNLNHAFKDLFKMQSNYVNKSQYDELRQIINTYLNKTANSLNNIIIAGEKLNMEKIN